MLVKSVKIGQKRDDSPDDFLSPTKSSATSKRISALKDEMTEFKIEEAPQVMERLRPTKLVIERHEPAETPRTADIISKLGGLSTKQLIEK